MSLGVAGRRLRPTRGQKEVERLDLIGVGLPIIESAKSAADSRRGHGGADESASGEP